MMAQSKEAHEVRVKEGAAERQARIVTAINKSVFQSVCQHMITLQSEPMLVSEICHGNVAQSARLLANTQGIAGLLGLFLNQAGGKFSDALGRKPGLLLGPLSNIIVGQLVFRYPGSRLLVLICRIVRMVLTTFSNTVMCTAALSDVCSGKDLALAMSTVGATTSLAAISAPFLESIILQRTGSPRYSYLALSLLGAVQLVHNLAAVPETLDAARRTVGGLALSLQSLNPFGFLQLYTKGSKALQKMVTIATFQMCLEGKNLSDVTEIWKREHLKWSIRGSRNFVVAHGILTVLSSVLLIPHLLKTRSPRAFTAVTDCANFAGFCLRGVAEAPIVFVLANLLALPGVNGASAAALKALSSDLAASEHFGRGEFSAWVNSLRAVAGSAAPVLYGNYYAWARRRGAPPGTVFMLAAIVGAVLPQVILWHTENDELRPARVVAASGTPPASECQSPMAAGSPARQH
uniref:Uncharacterized protein n=1 Tax=Alexandrium catenella TaxID=2925 RepID=A0A7S1R9X5_ALECA|mmetsp:Transcript_4811/g.12936  ORF Transcript_4811/g.12936 Transcript_4811/m.12936 type:complete len:463 (+) Transcript_4811:55-1443(+)